MPPIAPNFLTCIPPPSPFCGTERPLHSSGTVADRRALCVRLDLGKRWYNGDATANDPEGESTEVVQRSNGRRWNEQTAENSTMKRERWTYQTAKGRMIQQPKRATITRPMVKWSYSAY
eukprot:TRINITY_DN4586_c0_g2_i1.p1 TRINITY_DN4586_c0_g2~~TRINITY_DN4586_c0_g2_i1.p1  ORF type:complete len:119 (-),score=3.81 TRINITY_DN4586_c0_g2_i1:267-623(-)